MVSLASPAAVTAATKALPTTAELKAFYYPVAMGLFDLLVGRVELAPEDLIVIAFLLGSGHRASSRTKQSIAKRVAPVGMPSLSS